MHNKLKQASLIALLMGSTAVMAEAGFVKLSDPGFQIPGAEEGQLSAYTLCNLTGEFGTDEEGSKEPTFEPNGGEHNTCAIPSIPKDYKQIKNAKRNIVRSTFNNRFRPVKINIGFVLDRVWRSSTEGMCIFGAKVRLNNIDADRITPGKQYFEINDIARGGFENKYPPEIAYYYTANADEVLYRAGLTFNAVVFEPEAESEAMPSLTDAPIDKNWINFSTDLNYRDDDGSSHRDSPWMLVKVACGENDKIEVAPNALRFRQMGQEGQPELEIPVNGFVPVGGQTTTPPKN